MQAAVEPIKQIIGKDPLAFNLHLPMIMDCEKYLEMCEQFGGQEWFNWNRRTLYGNLYCYDAPFHPDVKNNDEVSGNYGQYDFLSTDDQTFTSDRFSLTDSKGKVTKLLSVAGYIKQKYCSKSIYEK
jgi:hypothetical protein